MEWLTDPSAWISLLTLTVLEIVLGVDNIIFITILAGKLSPEKRGKARTIGLMLALITRVILLSLIFFVTQLTKPAFVIRGHEITWKGIVLIAGGLFLIFKSVREVHSSLEGEEHEKASKVRAAMGAVIAQIVVIDIVFSLDSVITAVGLGQGIGVMITAVFLAMLVMLWASEAIGNFVDRHPTIKMLALSFLLMVGVVLVAEGLGHHIERGYIYFAMAFSFVVEMLNLKVRAARQKPVELRKEY
jgi:predicted tellurium resistance membrane protein TerC